MKQPNSKLPPAVALMGAAAFALRLSLYRFGVDEKGLLVSFHPLEILLWLLTAATVALTLLRVWKADSSCLHASGFPAAVGCFVFAAGMLLTVLAEWNIYTTLETVRNISGLLAAASLLWLGICRKTGKRPFFAFHAVVCLALTLHTISFYHTWSSCPQLQDAFFPLMGCIGLMLFSYYQTASDADMGSRRMQLGTGLLAAYVCFAAIAGSSTPWLYLTGGIWALTNLCQPLPPANPQKEETP